MPVKKQDVHRALKLLEEYRRNLTDADSEELREALTKAIVAIRSRLFQALLDIHDFYSYTLENTVKSTETKTEETLHLAEKWEKHPPPVPTETTQLAAKSLETVRMETVHIHLQRGPTGGLGVSVAGGRDNPHVVGSNGIFVTKLIPDTPATIDGRLSLGDQIISVNGTNLEEATHSDAVQTLKNSGKDVDLVVYRRREAESQVDHAVDDTDRVTENGGRVVLDITLNKQDRGLGFSIAGGRGNAHVVGDDGIFVTKIIVGGVAEMQGDLATGDRILEVCGEKVDGLNHEEAVSLLKATPQIVQMKVEKGALSKVTHSPQTSEADLQPQPERMVILNRIGGEGLGFNIIGGEGDAGIFISYIAPDGVADRSGGLKTGDQILKVNDVSIGDANHDEAAIAFKSAGNNVQLVVRHDLMEYNRFQERLKELSEVEDQQGSPSKPSLQPEPEPVRQLYVRALFDYDSSKDDDRPSQGLTFYHGDILHVLNTGDDEWWQAALVGNQADDRSQGLIPSKSRVERRALTGPRSVQFTSRNEQPHEVDHRARSVSEKEARRGLRSSFKLSRKLPFIKKAENSTGTDDEGRDIESVPTYEPVTLEPRGYARPVIILGALKEEINDMLVQEFPDKFAGCVPHTTRLARDGEEDGRDYHFVASVEKMEKDIQAHLFIEAGRYKDNLYGTSIQAVQEVAQQGKHCILGVSGFAIRRLQMADLHPIAICIRPSNIDVIQVSQPKMSGDQCSSMFDKGKRIEQEFAESFTAVVEGESLDDIYTKVKSVIHEQSGNFIWVPSADSL